MIATLVRGAILGVLLPGAAHLGAALVGNRGGIGASAAQQHVGIVHMQPGRCSRSRGSYRIKRDQPKNVSYVRILSEIATYDSLDPWTTTLPHCQYRQPAYDCVASNGKYPSRMPSRAGVPTCPGIANASPDATRSPSPIASCDIGSLVIAFDKGKHFRLHRTYK